MCDGSVMLLCTMLLNELALGVTPPAEQVLDSMASEVVMALAGKFGIVTQWYQRHCLVMGLDGVRTGVVQSHMPAPRASTIALQAIEVLLPLVERESHEHTRAVAVASLQRWVVLLGALPMNVLHSLKAGLRSAAKPVVTAFAAAVYELANNADVGIQLMSLLPELLNRMDVAKGKPNIVHADAIYALAASLKILAKMECMGEHLDADFPWDILTDERLALISVDAGASTPTSLMKAESSGHVTAEVYVALCQAIELGAAQLTARPSVSHGSTSSPAAIQGISHSSGLSLIQCALAADRSVRTRAIQAIENVRRLAPEAEVALLGAFHEVSLSTADDGSN